MRNRTGLLLAERSATPIAFKFSRYFNSAALPSPPPVFGHEALMTQNWEMLANDRYGDCFWAGIAHQFMLWQREGGAIKPSLFTAQDVLDDYSAATGFNPTNESSDRGTDPSLGFKYVRDIGVRDARNLRHMIDTYVAVNFDNLALASWLLGSCGVGVNCPNDIEEQFDSGQPWDIAPGQHATGDGHYVPCVGRNSHGNFVFVTWGRLQAATPKWVETYLDQAVAAFTNEMLDAAGFIA
jgi:hypothetical protein